MHKRIYIISILFIITTIILIGDSSKGLRKFMFFRDRYQHLSPTNDSSSPNLEALKSLSYTLWSSEKVEGEIDGVIKYNRDKSHFGYNLYTDYEKKAYLMDMTGQIVHQWQFPFQGSWEQVELLRNGEIVAICVGRCFIKLNQDSEVIWIYEIPVHHDIAVLKDNTYLVPVGKEPFLYNSRKVTFDSILHLSEEGRVLDEWSTFANHNKLKQLHYPSSLDKKRDIKTTGIVILDNYINRALDTIREYILTKNLIIEKGRENRLRQSTRYNLKNPQKQTKKGHLSFINRFKKYVEKILGIDKAYDYYHLNAVEILPDTPLASKNKRFQKGNYLLCLAHTNLILILDKDSKEVVWSWGPGILDRPHDPRMLKNGNILIFDNGARRSYSRVLEINPVDGHIAWKYETNPPQEFYSEYWGSSQRLANGNTLICESNRGRVFEITSEGEIVWEFLNQEIKGKRRKGIYQMVRIPKEKIEEWLRTTRRCPL